MARYIDADAVEKRIVDYYDAQLQSYPSSKDNKEKDRLLGGINYGRNVVRDAPTADVVPRAEVDKIERQNQYLQDEYLKLHDEYKKAKYDLPREIFEEIEKLLHVGVTEHLDCLDYYVKKGFAELKKKYTEV